MSQTNRTRLELESLEDRCVPSAGHALPTDLSAVNNVIYVPGAGVVDVIVTLPKGIVEAAHHGADFKLDLSLTYVSVNNTVETLDTGLVSINTGNVLNAIDSNTVAVDLNIPFGALPPPGNNPSYSGTLQVFTPAAGT